MNNKRAIGKCNTVLTGHNNENWYHLTRKQAMTGRQPKTTFLDLFCIEYANHAQLMTPSSTLDYSLYSTINFIYQNMPHQMNQTAPSKFNGLFLSFQD